MVRKSKRVSTVHTREYFSEVVNRVAYGDVDHILTRRGRDVLVCISMEAYHKFLELLKRSGEEL